MDIFRFIFLSVVNSMENFSRFLYDLRFFFFGAVSASLSEFVRFPYDLRFFFFGAASASSVLRLLLLVSLFDLLTTCVSFS